MAAAGGLEQSILVTLRWRHRRSARRCRVGSPAGTPAVVYRPGVFADELADAVGDLVDAALLLAADCSR